MDLTVIATGGTIDCVDEDGVLRPATSDLTPYLGRHELIRPFTILSENAGFVHYIKLAKIICALKSRSVIVTHGSDTLPYTAAALGFCLAGTDKTVVITAADKPLGDPSSNAYANLEASARVAGSGAGGVYVAYARRGCEADVYYGVRMNEARDFDGEYSAPAGALYASDGGRTVYGKPLAGKPLPPGFAPVAAYRFMPEMICPVSCGPVLIMGSHSGTASERQLYELSERCGSVWLCGGTGGLVYASKAALKGKIKFLDNIAWPAAYIKATLLFGGFPREKAEKMMTENLAGEFFC